MSIEDWEAIAADQAMTIVTLKDDIQRLNLAMETKLCVRGYEIQIADLEDALKAKREWVGLTEMDMLELDRKYYPRTFELMIAVEAKLKEKNA
jgi:hypothetical protein